MTLASSSPDAFLIEDQQPFDDPLLINAATDRSARYIVLGHKLLFETNESSVLDATSQSFGPSDRWSEGDANLSVRILTHDIAEEESWRPIQPVIRGQGAQFYIASSRASVVSGDADMGKAFGFISKNQTKHVEHLRSTIVQSPVLWMASWRALSSVHSACVVMDGVSIMIRGISNAGKTTLAYAALREGFSLLAEDVVFVYPSNGGVELRGLPWMLYLKQDAVRFFPELARLNAVDRYNGEVKIPIFVDELFPGQCVERASVGPTVFVEQNGGGKSKLHRLSEGEALVHLEQTRISMEYREADGVDVWGSLLQQPMYRFEVGSNPLDAAAMLKSLVRT